jgi:transcriptional regulator with XRE-family HTH domain
MNMVSKISKSPTTTASGVLLYEARHRRGYSLEDVAETTGLTVIEVQALEEGVDCDQSRLRRAASALGILDNICGRPPRPL